MIRMVRYLVIIVEVFGVFSGLAQCPVADFALDLSGCLAQNLSIINNTTGGGSYEWDFCSGDLTLSPNAVVAASNNLLFRTRSIRVIESNDNWYGFAIDQASSPYRIIRFSFGTKLQNPPIITDLGNPSNALNGAYDFQFHKESGNWFALVANSGGNNILRLNFGPNIESVPSVQDLGSFGLLSTPNGIEIVDDNGSLSVFVTNSGVSEITRLDFGSSIVNEPTPSSFSILGGATLRGVAIVKECDRWFGLVTSYGNNKILWMDFDNGLLQPPQSGEITFFTSYNFPASISLVEDGGEFYGFIQSAAGPLYKLSFGASVIDKNGVGVNLGNYGIAQNFATEWVKENSDWHGFSIDLGNRKLIRYAFPTTCDASRPIYQGANPPQIDYSTGGTKGVTLVARNGLGNSNSITKSISILTQTAPDISFTSQNVCANHDINFTSQNASGDITDYNWDFGDTNTSIAPNPTHQFTAAGDYEVSLQVTASNGCNNLARESITIYNEPIPDFNLPSATPICTNQPYNFSNASTFDSGSNPSWQWEVNGSTVSSDQDLTYLIPASEQQDVKLIASIPGCSNEVTKSILTVEDGPLANFTFNNDCEGASINFTNTTTEVGTGIGYNWDFVGANIPTSNQANEINSYSTFGQYDVTLTASNAEGCNNATTKQIIIYSKPQPDFSLELPPFSCSGSLSQFNDLTPNPVDSNLDNWSWSFGDPLNGTSNARHAQYLFDQAGTYDVNLEVTTNFGCSASVQKSVVITQSPSAEFSNGAACLNQATVFTPTTTADISAWHWRIGSATYDQQSPTHVFSVPSSYTAELTTTANNGCIAIASKPVTVLTAPVVDFSVTNACAEKATSFTDASVSVDELISRSWNFAGIGSSTGQNATFSFPSAGAYPTVLTVSTASGCNYSVSKGVIIASSPQASFVATPLSGVPPLTVSVTNSSTDVVTQLWSVVGGGSSTQPSAQFTFDQLGEYVIDLTVTNAAGCTDTDNKLISVIVPSLDVELRDITLVPISDGVFGILVELFNKSNTSVSGLMVNIDLAGVAELREMIDSTIPPNAGLSKLLSSNVVLDARSANYVCAEVVVDGDVNENNNRQCESLNALTVIRPFPNPASSEINLDWISVDSGNATISIYNSEGQLVFNNALDDYQLGLNHFTIPTTALNPGIYYILFVAENVRKSFPIVIRK